MIKARIRKSFPAGPEAAAFSIDVEFEASAGITVLFGPSGAGKTLILDSIAGFVKPAEGRILLDGAILFDGATGVHLPPQERSCGYVFQNYALFPHMNLRKNLEFAAHRVRTARAASKSQRKCWSASTSPRSPAAGRMSSPAGRSSAARSRAR